MAWRSQRPWKTRLWLSRAYALREGRFQQDDGFFFSRKPLRGPSSALQAGVLITQALPCQMSHVSQLFSLQAVPSTLLGVNLNESPVRPWETSFITANPELCKHHCMSLTRGSLSHWTPLPSPAFLLTVMTVCLHQLWSLSTCFNSISMLSYPISSFLKGDTVYTWNHLLFLLTVTSLDNPSPWESPLHAHTPLASQSGPNAKPFPLGPTCFYFFRYTY